MPRRALPVEDEVEEREEVLGVCGVLQFRIGRRETVIGKRDGAECRLRQATCERGVLRFVFTIDRYKYSWIEKVGG